MTTQQQSIIEALTLEFSRINNAKKVSKGFNLINTNALMEQTTANKEWAEASKQDLATWELAAYAEMERIMGLLDDDLPQHVLIDRFDTTIGKYRSPSIQLRHESVSGNTHHENVVSIHVNVVKEYKSNSFGLNEYFGKSLSYSTSEAYMRVYETIEEAVGESKFQQSLRKRVIR